MFLRSLRSRLVRETSDGAFIAPVDGLRFFAIMSVVLYHLQDYLAVKTARPPSDDLISLICSYGHLGVPLFFVISGFIIARPFLDGSFAGVSRYFRRRLTRLEPPYALNLLIVWMLLVLVRGDDGVDLLPNLLASLVYQHGLLYDSMSTINFVAWSLEVEFQFYVLAPVLLGLLRSNAGIRRLALMILLVIGCFNYALQPAPIGLALVNYVGFFAAGILVAEVFVFAWGKQLPAAWPFDIVLLASLLLLVWSRSGVVLFIDLAPLALGGVVLGGLGGVVSARLLSFPFLYLVGGMCYTLYLYHFLVISALGRFLLPWLDRDGPMLPDLIVAIGVIVPGVILFGALMFVLVERPFMRARRPREPRGVPIGHGA